jgi:hypothetical protein
MDEKNTIQYPHLNDEDRQWAEQVGEEYAVWPKAWYHLADKPVFLADGRPDPEHPVKYKADKVNPNYPMPYQVAIDNGLHGQVSGSGITHSIDIVHSYVTCFVPLGWDPNYPIEIDEAKCKREEATLLKEGWVDHPSKLQNKKVAEVG